MQAWSPFQAGFFTGVFLGSPEYPELNAVIDRLAGQYDVPPIAIATAWITRHPANMQVVLGTTNPERVTAAAAGFRHPAHPSGVVRAVPGGGVPGALTGVSARSRRKPVPTSVQGPSAAEVRAHTMMLVLPTSGPATRSGDHFFPWPAPVPSDDGRLGQKIGSHGVSCFPRYGAWMPDVSEHARMVPMLPCADIDQLAEFWTSLGLQITYRQIRPNPYLALRRNAIELHYYGMAGFDPDQSHSTCSIVVPDTAPLHELFAEGLRSRYGRVPMRGFPRITRPRQRANNAGLSGFSLVDPAGNWIRVSRQPDDAHQPRTIDARTERVTGGGGPLARAVENAVVVADSHGDEGQAERILSGAVARHPEAPIVEQASAWAYLAELRVRLDDIAGAQDAATEVSRLARAALPPLDRDTLDRAMRDVAELFTIHPNPPARSAMKPSS